jgi:hypothetical protein
MPYTCSIAKIKLFLWYYSYFKIKKFFFQFWWGRSNVNHLKETCCVCIVCRTHWRLVFSVAKPELPYDPLPTGLHSKANGDDAAAQLSIIAFFSHKGVL